MYPYKKEQTALLYDLITQANPGVVYPLSASNIIFSLPTTIVPVVGSIADTELVLVGKDTYYGNQKVKYRRINLTSFFNGMTIKLYEYHPTPAVINSNDVIRMMNEKYGLALTAGDFNLMPSISANATFQLTVKSTSLCYKGFFKFIWIRSGAPIDLTFTANEVSGLTFPGGNVFNDNRKPQGEYFCYDLDFTPIKTVINTIPGAYVWNGASFPEVMQFLRDNVSEIFTTGAHHTVGGGLNGLTALRYPMPHPLYPEANIQSSKYKSILIFAAKPDSWFQGKIIMHYTP